MIHTYTSLNGRQLAAVKELVKECETYDKAKTCIQIDNSLNAKKDMPSWFLEYDKGTLLAVGSVFAPMEDEAEISVCVKTDHRNKGKGTALLSLVKEELKLNGITRILLVCDSVSAAGKAFVAAQPDKKKEHSEYTLELGNRDPVSPSRLEIVGASADDVGAIVRVLVDAFNDDEESTTKYIVSSLQNEHRKGYVGKLNGEVVCTCFIGYEENEVSINTVATLKREQGKGYAKEFLTRVITEKISGENRIVINVDDTNERAYNLYKRIGFQEKETIDYYELFS